MTAQAVHLVCSGHEWGPDYVVHRSYLDSDEAQVFCDAVNKATVTSRNDEGLGYYVKSVPIGAGDAAYDGPLYTASWALHPKGSYFYDAPGHILAEDRQSWHLPWGQGCPEGNDTLTSWHVGPDPSPATLHATNANHLLDPSKMAYINVMGSDADAVVKLLRAAAAAYLDQRNGGPT